MKVTTALKKKLLVKYRKVQITTPDTTLLKLLLLPYYLTVECSTFKTYEKVIMTIKLEASQTLKQIYRKPKYSKKVFEEFQRLPRFPRKMVLYSSTKFGILKP